MKAGTNKNYIQLSVAMISVILFVVSLFPVFHLALYNTPAADDFAYGTPVYYVIKNDGNILDLIRTVFDNIRYTYFNWQGTYSSVLLFSIHPGVINERLYSITPFFLIFMIVVPFYTALFAIKNMEIWGKIVIGSILSFIALQYMPSSADGIYWWNGAVHYIIFWSISILIILLQINIQNSYKNDKNLCFKTIIAFLGSSFICGGNYSSALSFTLAISFITACSIIYKKKTYIILSNVIVTTVSIFCLTISAIAPGNDIRQSSLEKSSALSAIVLSFKQASIALRSFTDVKIIIALLLCVLIFIRSGRLIKLNFPHPMIILTGSFCFFAAQYTPPLYTMGACDLPRLNNILYLSYLMFVFGNVFYIIGFILKRFENICIKTIYKNISFLFTIILFISSIIFSYRTSNSYIAFNDLTSDTLKEYTTEIQRREHINNNKQDADRFIPINQFPSSFHPSPVQTWMPNIIIDGKSSDIKIYRSCGGEVTFIGLEDAINYFNTDIYKENQFTKIFLIDKKICIPIREFTDKQGYNIDYNLETDTINITTK